MTTITVAVPSFSRPNELRELIESVLDADELPDELLICEDRSPLRDEIAAVVDSYREAFAATACRLSYVENEQNLGYDGNIRNLFQQASSDYVLILGDDDVIYANTIAESRRFIDAHPGIAFISRTYSRFSASPRDIINTTWLRGEDCVVDPSNSTPNLVFRLCGFVGGLIVKRDWANDKATTRYDGSLYYQFYLACLAYYETGIGYIFASIVGGRAGNPPLFGSAEHEKDVHIPGSYRPKGRAKMWAGLLRIAADVDALGHAGLYHSMRNEIAGRQSFHIFEMMPVQGRKATLELFCELRRLRLTHKLLPWLLTTFICVFGSYAGLGFALFRKLQFSIEGGIGVKM
ncbi:glycosyltransferase family 2 protein [Chromobacterium vaccinii]|uniref:glycosyltransferase family 2 protein n=1 Tax=Chromobacterium vaccinii TaxID=1108595 RepID=UPI003C772C7B